MPFPDPLDRADAARGAPPRPGPVVLLPRRIPGGVAATLDALPADVLPRLRFEGTVPALRPRLRAAFAERVLRPRWLANWLLDDVLDKVALLAELASPTPLVMVMRLEVEAEGRDRPFEVGAGRHRLVTDYRGAGTEWLSPRSAAAPEERFFAGALRHLPRGDVAILRGDASDEGAAVLHRPRAGSAGASLRLTVDVLARARRRLSPLLAH